MDINDNKTLAVSIFNAALQAVDPFESVSHHTSKIRSVYEKSGCKRMFVIGFGKASYPMAKALVNNLADLIETGIIITKYGHSGSEKLDKITVFEAGHPLPDENGLKYTKHIINLAKDSDEETFLICLISGGGSSLLVSPYKGISLEEKQIMTRLLLQAGADIYELNTVRKHISNVKGGRLAEIAYPARVISLILSDVIGNRLDVIASGPLSPDITTYSNATGVIEKYRLGQRLPRPVMEIMEQGRKGHIPETPKADEPVFKRVENLIIGSNVNALKAAYEKAGNLGLNAEIIASGITGEAREAGKILAEKAKEKQRQRNFKGPLCLISGGETTVTVTGNGLGGRNTELALSFAMEIEENEGITFLSAGTDGTDGPTDAAGALADGQTVKMAKASGLNPREYLNNNDSYNFFKKINGLFITGPTGTNVMDIQIAIIE